MIFQSLSEKSLNTESQLLNLKAKNLNVFELCDKKKQFTISG